MQLSCVISSFRLISRALILKLVLGGVRAFKQVYTRHDYMISSTRLSQLFLTCVLIGAIFFLAQKSQVVQAQCGFGTAGCNPPATAVPPQPTAPPVDPNPPDPNATEPPNQNNPTHAPQGPAPVCGNHVIEGNEQCECPADSNTPWFCQIEPLYACTGGCVKQLNPTQCADGIDNNDPEDALLPLKDCDDPACHLESDLSKACNQMISSEIDVPAPIVTPTCVGNTLSFPFTVQWSYFSYSIQIRIDNDNNLANGSWSQFITAITATTTNKVITSSQFTPLAPATGTFTIPNNGTGPVYVTIYYAGNHNTFSRSTEVKCPPNTPTPTATEGPGIGGPGLAMCGQGCIDSFECETNYACQAGVCQLAVCQSDVVCETGNCVMICPGITMSPSNPEVGESVQFTCTDIPGAVHYDFQIIDKDKEIREYSSDSRVSPWVLISKSGHHDVQCRACMGTTLDTCQEFSLLP